MTLKHNITTLYGRFLWSLKCMFVPVWCSRGWFSTKFSSLKYMYQFRQTKHLCSVFPGWKKGGSSKGEGSFSEEYGVFYDYRHTLVIANNQDRKNLLSNSNHIFKDGILLLADPLKWSVTVLGKWLTDFHTITERRFSHRDKEGSTDSQWRQKDS